MARPPVRDVRHPTLHKIHGQLTVMSITKCPCRPDVHIGVRDHLLMTQRLDADAVLRQLDDEISLVHASRLVSVALTLSGVQSVSVAVSNPAGFCLPRGTGPDGRWTRPSGPRRGRASTNGPKSAIRHEQARRSARRETTETSRRARTAHGRSGGARIR